MVLEGNMFLRGPGCARTVLYLLPEYARPRAETHGRTPYDVHSAPNNAIKPKLHVNFQFLAVGTALPFLSRRCIWEARFLHTPSNFTVAYSNHAGLIIIVITLRVTSSLNYYSTKVPKCKIQSPGYLVCLSTTFGKNPKAPRRQTLFPTHRRPGWWRGRRRPDQTARSPRSAIPVCRVELLGGKVVSIVRVRCTYRLERWR